MKKFFYGLIIVTLLIGFTSCKKKSEVSEINMDSLETLESLKVREIPKIINLDFTKMNYNMVSSITFEMLVEPENYVDKSVKIAGKYYASEHEGKMYYSVFIWDASGCCPAGLSFIPAGNTKEQMQNLVQEQEITVTGTMKLLPLEDGTKGLFFIAQLIE